METKLKSLCPSNAATCSRAEITPARGRRLVPFRNCFCGVQAEKFYYGSFLCLKHWKMDRARYMQDPEVTAANIKECNARCERERSARLKAAGLCVTCGKREANPQATRCEVCQAKRRKPKVTEQKGRHLWKRWNDLTFKKSA